MSKRYPGNFITGNPVALSQTSNNGVWDLKDNYTATSSGNWQEADGIYEISRSLRFKSGSTQYLYRVPNTAGNKRSYTFSCWFKRGKLGTNQNLICSTSVGIISKLLFNTSDQLEFQNNTDSTDVITTAVFKDVAAWYHIVLSVDSNNAITTNRVKIWVNGVQQTCTGTYPTINTDMIWNGTIGHWISSESSGVNYLDGHMAEAYHIDGQSLDASYFGYTDSITGIWQPKQYTGGYGTNGFYFPFTDNSSLNALGKNFAGTNYTTNSLTPSGTYQSTTNTTSTTGAFGETVTVTQAIPNNSVATGNPFTTIWNNDSLGTYVGNGQNYTQSALVKPLVFPLSLQLYDNGTGAGGGQVVTFSDANTYSVTAGNRDGVIKLANGWYRIWSTIPFPSSGHYKQLYCYTHPTGNGSTPHYQIYGWQINQGIGPDPLIQTSGTAAANDYILNNFTLNTGDWINTCSFIDSPTNVFTTATDVGGTVPGNYPLLNAAVPSTGTIQSANSYVTTSTTNATSGTIFANTGKWYAEVYIAANAGNNAAIRIGVVNTSGAGVGFGESANGWSFLGDGRVYNNGSTSTYGTSITTGDIANIALDLDAGKVWYGKNGTWMASGNPVTGANPSQTFTANQYMTFAVASGTGSPQYGINFGAINFSYTPPSGYKSLNTTNLQALGTSATAVAGIQSNKWFDVSLYGGTGTWQTIVNSGFQPDLVWGKPRTVAHSNTFVDSVRGPSYSWYTNASVAEENQNLYGSVSSFNTNGFGLGANGGNVLNNNGQGYVAWQWKQSPTAGFNIVSYTGDGTNTKSISHNLGVKPSMIIIKNRDATGNPVLEHASLPDGRILIMNDTQGQSGQFLTEFRFYLRSSSNFQVGSYGGGSNTNNNGQKYIAYLWAEVPGFSKFGTYTGNFSTDGPFVYTGFRPRFIMIKSTGSSSGSWVIIDTTRTLSNGGNINTLIADGSGAEQTYSDYIRVHSSGFKVSNTVGGSWTNTSAETYVYAAFAESPFALNNRAR